MRLRFASQQIVIPNISMLKSPGIAFLMGIIVPMSIKSLLAHWRSDPQTGPNFGVWKNIPPRPADLKAIPSDMPYTLREILTSRGIQALYSHQAEAWEVARAGGNMAVATGTASGKTLAYNLPVLAALLKDENGRALYMFPTKALAQDQLNTLERLNVPTFQRSNVQTAIYDGDTPQRDRKSIRERAHIILTNPDMLHTGILPHHTNWMVFFHNLRFVVIDEMHTYRGVFGSHVANVIRRLKRVADHYGANPQFILTSATIGNPRELGEKLIEEPITLIDQDGSARGERYFLIYNPPVVEPGLGLRKSIFQESLRLGQDLLAQGLQSVIFARSRRSVELILKYLQGSGDQGAGNQVTRLPDSLSSHPLSPNPIQGYRSGYLPSQRREIEKGLRDGSVRMVVATNALELGIDIGGLEAAILVGYPGTIASTWQQAGRAGRGDAPAMAILMASPDPLDQFLARHPDYFFGRSPEQGLINPDHLLILLNHLRCATFELPFNKDEGFGNLPPGQTAEFLDFLAQAGDLHHSSEKYFWMADAYPAAGVSLRSASPENVILQSEQDGQPQTIGEVDLASAYWMVHPRAVYLHHGQTYHVQELDLNQNRAHLVEANVDYYTSPLRRTSVEIESLNEQARIPGGSKSWGELEVITQVVGFRKLRWFTNERLGEEPLEMPSSALQTTGYWVNISDETVKGLSQEGLWSNASNDYGPGWNRIRERVRERDGFNCQVCGRMENGREHDVHHCVPFRTFRDEAGRIDRERANQLDNLVTLCPECHHKVETNVRVRSGLAGLGYVLSQLAPLFLMCDPGDLGVFSDPAWAAAEGKPSVVLYDQVPAGIGFSQKLFEIHAELMARALELARACSCEDGCPSCVGAAGENGMGGKQETVAILQKMIR